MYDSIKLDSEKWFEYHCNESHSSDDAQLWYRSHQKVKVLEIENLENFHLGTTMKERIEELGCPLAYKIKFEDGFEGTAYEDELLNSPEEFTREDPPVPV